MRRLIVMVLGVCVWSGAAFGHAELDKSAPKVGEKVARAPRTVTIAFTEDLEAQGSVIQVFDARGKEVDKGDSHVEGEDRSTMAVSLAEKLPAGKYTVKWRAHCVFDHRTEGSFHFVVEDGGTARGD
ncbi:MAG: copper resistance CopC family protein [Phycisphaerae bacterium]